MSRRRYQVDLVAVPDARMRGAGIEKGLTVISRVLVDSVPWADVRSANGGAEFAPDAMRDLLHASSEGEALDAYWRLDNRVVLQGTLFEPARWVIGPLLAGLATERPAFVREHVVNLLVEIALGIPIEPTEPSLDGLCYDELRKGLWTIYVLLDDDVPMVRLGV